MIIKTTTNAIVITAPAWVEGVAMKGCASAASVVHELLSVLDSAGSLLEKSGRSPPVLGDIPLLANFNLQTFCQAGWYFILVTFISSLSVHCSKLLNFVATFLFSLILQIGKIPIYWMPWWPW